MIRKINQLSLKFLYWSTALTTSLFFIIVILSIATRYIFKVPILGSIEMGRLLFIWACFLAAGICYYRNAHIAITFVVDKFPETLQRLTAQFTNGLALVFFGMLVYYSLEVIILLWRTELPIMGISQAWLYIPLTLVSVISFLFTIEKMAAPKRPLGALQTN